MEPISIALALAKATGLSDWLGEKINGKKGAEVAGKVIDIATGLTGGMSPDDLVTCAKQDQEFAQALRAKLLDNAHEIDKLAFADIKDARAMQVAALAQDDVFSKRFVYYLAAFWSVLTAVYIGAITFTAIPETNVRFADTILGFLLGTIVGTIMQYFYGSSRGSHGKDAAIAQIVEKIGKSK